MTSDLNSQGLAAAPAAQPSAVIQPRVAVIDRGMLSIADILARTHRIKEIQSTVMKPNMHYGVIPGTQKPTLYQPGADILNVTFRIAPKVALIEDLSTADAVRYRVHVDGNSQGTEEFLGSGVGECSSDEEKYRWRKAVCKEEWDEAPPDRRREKWGRGQGGKSYKIQQIRTSPADVANTVLKMAVKRAKIAMTLNVTAASDVFAQDLEDLSKDLREHLIADEDVAGEPRPQAAQRISETAAPAAAGAAATPTQKTAPPAPIGVIVAVEPRGDNAAVIVLDTGFKCSTRDAELMTAAAGHRDTKRRVELVTRASSNPALYAPILTEILPMEDGQA
ncbi:MAG: hypothetical protein AB7O67_23670 [Vicinamibacterales bacterium]